MRSAMSFYRCAYRKLYVKPTDRVGIVGIGGLGHMALQFANAWGCEVTAFTSNASKADEVQKFGVHRVVSSRGSAETLKAVSSLDCLLITVNTPLDLDSLLKTLKPNGRMHIVGAVLADADPGHCLDIRAKDCFGVSHRRSGNDFRDARFRGTARDHAPSRALSNEQDE
jgi:D-arabinose 1-dehydrogenase-like Zn-dependent alcohol dehydrogenase